MDTKRWTDALTSRLFGPRRAAKIPVYPVSLGRDGAPLEWWSSFYALGCLTAYAKQHRDGELNERFDFGRITPRAASDIPAMLDQLPAGPGIFLLSMYVWNHDINLEFARGVKQRRPGSLVIVGGPHVPRAAAACDTYFAKHAAVDVTVRHEGEVTLAELLRAIGHAGLDVEDFQRADLSTVEGLTFRRGDQLVRTPDRARTMDLAIYPSPYTTGEFDHWIDGRQYLPIETNRGCPYGCTFCDWGAATLAKIARMSMDRVLAELEFAARHQIGIIGFCDANFGILPRDVDIARFVVEMKERYGFPREIGYTNAKTASPRLLDIIKILSDGGLISSGQISMQTTDEQVLENVERSNIKMSEYRKMITFFHKEDIPAVSDLMLGLPGQTFESCKADLQFCFDHKVLPMIFATSVMPNAPIADEAYQRKFQITVGADGFVESTYSFTREEYARMFDLCLAYKLFVKVGLLKYLLYFVQIEHGVRATDFLERWLAQTEEHPELYPMSARIRRELLQRERSGGLKDWLSIVWADNQAQFLFDAMDDFHREILGFFEREHGVRLGGTDVAAILTTTREVMPKKGRALPASGTVDHDVAAYFHELRQLPSLDAMPPDHLRLKQRGPGVIELKPQPETTSYDFVDVISLVGKLELASNVHI
ncbi:MAG TPA: radical SAM protein [Vicinamibacterales bacterium]|nr:radical SAM protein [Vicinamibacterales bacterium]